MAPRHILVLLFAAFLQQVERTFAYPDGVRDIAGVCSTFMPGHGTSAQSVPSPYGIDISGGGTYTPGLTYEGKLITLIFKTTHQLSCLCFELLPTPLERFSFRCILFIFNR